MDADFVFITLAEPWIYRSPEVTIIFSEPGEHPVSPQVKAQALAEGVITESEGTGNDPRRTKGSAAKAEG